jgi:hypothetical protein
MSSSLKASLFKNTSFNRTTPFYCVIAGSILLAVSVFLPWFMINGAEKISWISGLGWSFPVTSPAKEGVIVFGIALLIFVLAFFLPKFKSNFLTLTLIGLGIIALILLLSKVGGFSEISATATAVNENGESTISFQGIKTATFGIYIGITATSLIIVSSFVAFFTAKNR